MNKHILLIFLFVCTQRVFSQSTIKVSKETYESLTKLDNEIDRLDRYKIEVSNKTLKQAFFNSYPKLLQKVKTDSSVNYLEMINTKTDLIRSLYNLLDLNNINADPDLIQYLAEQITHLSTIFLLDKYIENECVANNFRLKRNFDIIKEVLKEKTDKQLMMYTIRGYKPQLFKGVDVSHTNDILQIAPRYNKKGIKSETETKKFWLQNNHDRDLTGAFRFEFYTDYLQMRFNKIISAPGSALFNWFITKFHFNDSNYQKYLIEQDNYFSYQSFFINGSGYTPNLRDTFILSQPNSFDPLDRPYASYIGFGFAKYRLHRKGIYRTNQEFSLGKIGSMSPYGLQSRIHSDFVIASFNPNGWQAQIAAGGRWGVQYQINHELMLLSHSENLWHDADSWVPKKMNIYGILGGKLGCQLTAYETGIGFSTFSFLNQNASGQVKRAMAWHREDWRTNISAQVIYRRVIHNSMLEGFGYVSHMIDNYPGTPNDTHIVDPSWVNRNLVLGNLKLNFSRGKVHLYWSNNFISSEIIKEKIINGVATQKYKHYFEHDFKYKNKDYTYRRRASGLDFFGTLGIIFQL